MSAADIKQKLERLNIRANAALGQNFLCDDAMIEKIASAAVGDGKTAILEIGPGLGALTGALVGRVPRVTAVEIDKSMLAALNAEFAAEIGRGELTLIHSDILKFDISSTEGEFAAAGNLHYYITTPIVLCSFAMPKGYRAWCCWFRRRPRAAFSQSPRTSFTARLP